jgi:hypothetical protein
LDDYAILKEKSSATAAWFNELSVRIKGLDTALTSNANLQKHIINYSKIRQTYIEYHKSSYSKKFKELHEADILLHQAAKKSFDELDLKKLPTVASLCAEYAPMPEEKKKVYSEYRQVKSEMRELLTAKHNVDKLFNITDRQTEREHPML